MPPRYWTERQNHPIIDILDRKLIEKAMPALERASSRVVFDVDIKNVDRSAGAMLSGEVAKRYGHKGLKDDTIHVTLNGTAGQSFGAFLARGITFDLVGDGNDYVGKGLSGGRIIVRPPENARIVAGKLDHRRQHRASTVRSPASAISAAWPASASPSATRARSRWSRARATTAANT